MKKILMLGGIRYLLPVIKAAHDKGCYVITCDYLPNNVAHRYSDEFCNVSITDKERVLAAASELGVDGIMSFGTDPGVETAAYVAEKLSLPSCGSYEAVRVLQQKSLFRKFLKDNGYRVFCIDKERVHDAGLVWNHMPWGVEDETGDKPLQERIDLELIN